MLGKIQELLGPERRFPAAPHLHDHPARTCCTLPVPISSTASGSTPTARLPCCGICGALFGHGRPRRHRLRLDPAGRPGHRALGRRELRAEPDLLRPREHRRARDRGRLQRRRRAPSACSARSRKRYAHRIPFILKFNHSELITYPNKFDQIVFASMKQAFDMGCGRRRRDHLLRLRRVGSRQLAGGRASVRAGARARHVHRALVLPPQQRLQDREGATTTSPPISRVRRTTSASTIQADIIKQKLPTNNGGYTALKLRQDPRQGLHRAHDRSPDRSSAATRWRTATWAAAASSTRAARPGKNDLADAVQTAVDQQARRRHRAHLGPQGLPEAHEAGRGDPEHDSGRLPLQGDRPAPRHRATTRATAGRSRRDPAGRSARRRHGSERRRRAPCADVPPSDGAPSSAEAAARPEGGRAATTWVPPRRA